MNQKSIQDLLLKLVRDASRQPLGNHHLLLKDLFLLFCRDLDPADEYTVLTTEGHRILALRHPDGTDSASGYLIPEDAWPEWQQLFPVIAEKDGLCVLSAPDRRADQLARLLEKLTAIDEVVSKNEQRNAGLLHCFDAVGKSISIYDKEARLLFANRSFCEEYDIEDRDAVYGLPIQTIFYRNGISVHSIVGGSNRNRMKMMDVLTTGVEALDWEVKVQKEKDPHEDHLVSNDMYPIPGEKGDTTGLVEITRSRQQDILQTRRLIGLDAECTFDDIIGESPVIQGLIQNARRFADNPFSVLINGESGVGKDLVAQAIHNESSRRNGPFVAVNCASFPENLIESELFGYVGGAFTGASKNGQIGKFELADKGTLFLDEIGELPLHMQPKLLRVLETWRVTRIGSSQPVSVDVRLLAATNRDLLQMVSDGLFREDLYYRLQVLNILIPPLRNRGNDVLLLARHFLAQNASLSGTSAKTLDADASDALLSYDWPGNVRELRNVMSRATILAKSDTITRDIIENSIFFNDPLRRGSEPAERGAVRQSAADDLPWEQRHDTLLQAVDTAYAELLSGAMKESGGNKVKAAELLGISRRTFYRMLEKYSV